MKDLSIVIVSYNTKELLMDCINSVKKNAKGINYEMLVVDNASKDGSSDVAARLGAKVIRNKENKGFAAGNNQGARASKGRYILFLNSDTIVKSPIFAPLISWMDDNEDVGAASCALKNEDGSLQATGGYFPTLLRVFSWMTIQDLPFVDSIIKPFHPLHSKSFFSKGEDFYKKRRELDWVTGAFVLVRSKALKKVGGWDEKYFMYVEEVDLCFKIKKLGYKVWYLPKWEITHLGGKSSETKGSHLTMEFNGIKRFYKKFFPSWQYPFVRLFLKIGALGRVILFGILEGKETAKIYAKIFISV